MREFGNPLGDRPPLDELARTDLLLDALAEREEVDFADPRDDALAALLGQWRDDLRWPPASALVSPDEAVAALRTGVAQRRRARRSLAAVGSVAAALLVLSGFGAVVADARPGDLLYGLHAMMFNRSRVSDDQIVLSAKANLAKVEQMIAQGQWAEAQDELAEVSSTVQAVTDGSRRQDLINEVNLLNTKVETRDPNATLGPGSPSNPAAPGSVGNSWTPLAPVVEPPTPSTPASASEPSTSTSTAAASPSTTSAPGPGTPAATPSKPEPGSIDPSLEPADAATNPPSPAGQPAPETPVNPTH
ncbi:anti-sigma-D factor RsdA [Mycobacterium canetti]|uniref:anti-sigma-D factor RsdA n=1 Tax=Mycobacterium canetti TaxID=78331 RepID=UPI0032E425CF